MFNYKPHGNIDGASVSLPKYADNILHFCFQKIKAGDIDSSQRALRRVQKMITPSSPVYFATVLISAIGFLRFGNYEQAIQSLSNCISTSGYTVHGLCDALIILTESYSSLSKYEEALQSARLAVDVAHDRFERVQPPHSSSHEDELATRSDNKDKSSTEPATSTPDDLERSESGVNGASSEILLHLAPDELEIGPVLDAPTALVAAYYTLACQLDNNGMPKLAVEWLQRAYAAALKFCLNKDTCRHLLKSQQHITNSFSKMQSSTARYSARRLQEEQCKLIERETNDTSSKSRDVEADGVLPDIYVYENVIESGNREKIPMLLSEDIDNIDVDSPMSIGQMNRQLTGEQRDNLYDCMPDSATLASTVEIEKVSAEKTAMKITEDSQSARRKKNSKSSASRLNFSPSSASRSSTPSMSKLVQYTVSEMGQRGTTDRSPTTHGLKRNKTKRANGFVDSSPLIPSPSPSSTPSSTYGLERPPNTQRSIHTPPPSKNKEEKLLPTGVPTSVDYILEGEDHYEQAREKR